MTVKTADRKERPPRSFWFDPRFVVGVVLVIASVAGVVVLVGSVDSTVTVYAARSSFTAGERIDLSDVVEQAVRLDTVTDKYIVSGEFPEDGVVVTRTIAEGELLPVSAVGNVAGIRIASVVITVAGQLPKAVGAGTVVDVWAARESESGMFGPPSVLVSDATVVRLITTDGIIAGANAVGVEILVPRTRTARILEAVANQDSLSLVPVSLPANLADKG